MSIAIQPRRNEPDEDATQAAAIVNSNKNQQWYQKLCRGGEQPVYLEEQKVYPSPQRVQLQLHFQREYQQRQELQKNCRQDWWQRKSGSVAPSPSPVHFRTPSPAPGHKYYSNGPLFYQESPHHQPSPNVMPRGRTPQPPTNSYYQPSAAGVQARSENRRRTECELVDSEREKMIKTAQVIKLDAEKRIRQAKRELAASSSDQENIQRLLIQLLKEQDLAQKLKLSNQTPPTPNPISHLSADLQYKLATLLQAYQPTPPQQLSTNQRKWQEQIATYKDMLQEYRHGNFFQSHQKAKRLLQLLLQKDPNAHLHLPPQFYTSHPQQQTMYQQPPNQVGNSNMQPYFRTPFPQPAVRSRRDPRLNRSSQQLQTQVHDITPRLNQSSCQYSEQDITPEIIYPADVSARPGTVRRNSTPRKQTDEQVTHGENVSTVVEGAKKHSEQHVKFAENLEIEKDYQKPVETSRGANVTKAHAPVAAVEHDCDNQAGSRAPLQDWEQLQQRSRRHRRGRGVRRSSQESEGNDQKKPVDGKGGKTSPVLSNAKGQKHSPVNQKPHGDIPRRNADAMAEGEGRKSFPDDEVQHKDIVSQSESKTETQLEPADYSDKKDHPG
ncbi:uncharacterized protein LOC143296087 [Babylonia areolata]|uniref:uncharacterized protein LOC143296087 n=1 Tax=Babylonia areolata TaxID=304850 RepID=UPI003FD2CDED